MYEKGFLEERTTIQPYCEKHESFLADRFVEGECPLCGYSDARGDQCDKCGHLLDALDLKNPRCKLDGAAPIPRETKHIFILLDKLQPEVEEWSKKSISEGAWTSNGAAITETWLKEGLKPRGITRDFKWGVTVPLVGYEKKVLYVWFEACIGYPSITANYTNQWEKWWRNPENVRLYQFLGKDNVPFHSVIFPACQIGTGDVWTQLHHLSTTEYLNYEKGKFSKSRGIGVFGTNAKETGVPSDVWRYYLLSHRPEGGDTEFEWDGFIESNNNQLLKNLGNFVNRIIKFVNSNIYNSVVPVYDISGDKSLNDHIEEVNKYLAIYNTELTSVKLKAGLATAMHMSYLGNKLLQENKIDNKLANENPKKCAAVVGVALNHVHLLASLIAPYMPATSSSILRQLNAAFLTIPDKWSADSIAIKHKIGQAEYLFTVIKAEKEKEWREAFGGDEARKAKDERAAKAAAKKAEKLRKKEKKLGAGQPTSALESVETIEKGGREGVHSDKTAIEEVTDGVKQAVLQSS